jgi:hypothetical protein
MDAGSGVMELSSCSAVCDFMLEAWIKLDLVGVFTPWKLASGINQAYPLHKLINIHQPSSSHSLLPSLTPHGGDRSDTMNLRASGERSSHGDTGEGKRCQSWKMVEKPDRGLCGTLGKDDLAKSRSWTYLPRHLS